ncbi:Wrky transcription factor [Thalictrum thalictroides]|uniref:Wrky transcription factor n=1 Tax=Thalictrum thalictroides TaxID=46969 RepID=A0A7J6VWX5_THATH|nr:Wrky transcription factor [Thalictrum thalictroides]
MEAQDAERIVITKPVPSRPSCSSLNSVSRLLSGTISTSSPSSLSETAVPAIRPKTVRIKSAAVNRASVAIVSSQDEASGTAGCYSSENILNPEIKSTVVYKPLAKLVSSKTVHLLANLENFDVGNQYAVSQMQSQVQHANNGDHHLQGQHASSLNENLPSQVKTGQTSESSQAASQNLDGNQRATMSGDRPSYDGYNWRKYGQKQVKGSEYPRSYYKCTHPNCPVKKKVERSFDGQIAEIVYKGEHNHSKPQPPKRHSLGLQEQGLASDVSGQETGNPSWSNTSTVRSEGSERRIDYPNGPKLSVNPSSAGKAKKPYDSSMFGAFNSSLVITTDSSCGLNGDCEEGSKRTCAEDQPKNKRRKNDHQSNEVAILGQGVQDPHVMVQSSSDSEVFGDGFRWRKYGQKVVKGNPYPRSYYRCTTIKCNVRKHVERAVDDPRAFITTYEGKHNHERPTVGNLNPVASDPDSATPPNKGK